MFIYDQLLDVNFDLWDGFVRVFVATFNLEFFCYSCLVLAPTVYV